MKSRVKSKEDSLMTLPYPFYITQTFSVQKDQGVVQLGGVGYTPHPNALGFRPHCGTQDEACKRRGESNMDVWGSLEFSELKFST